MAKITSKKDGSFVDRLMNKFNSDKTVKLQDVDPFKAVTGWTSTGSPSLDYHLHTLGYPVGIIEMRGVSKSGKTTMSLHALKQAASDVNAILVILSSERRDNKAYAKQIGVPVERVIVHQIKSIEDMFNKVQQTITFTEELFKTEGVEGRPKYLFVWDSLGATISEQEKTKMTTAASKNETDHASAAMGSAARALKRGLRYVTGEVYDKDICLYIINHSYDKIGSFIPGKESYGGNGIKYMPTMRLEATYIGQVKVAGEKVGQLSTIEVIKSDFTSNLAKIEIEIGYGLGLILTESDCKFGLDADILQREGKSGYSFMNGKLKWKNRIQLYDLYRERNPFLKVLTNKLIKLAHSQVIAERQTEGVD